MSTEELAKWLRRKLRYCYSVHSCVLCGKDIRLGEFYRDGGYGRRAHDECVAKAAINTREEIKHD